MNLERAFRQHPLTALAAVALTGFLACVPPGAQAAGLPISKIVASGPSFAKAVCTLPVPAFSVSPSPIVLPTTPPNSTSASIPVTISNTGTADLVVYAATAHDPPCDCSLIFTVDFSGCTGVPIPPGGTCAGSASFNTGTGGFGPGDVIAGTVEFNSNDPANNTVMVPISGTVAGTLLSVSPLLVDFGATSAVRR